MEEKPCPAILTGRRSSTRRAPSTRKRGKLWSKLSRAIIIAARHGGGDPTMNLKLRYAIDKARAGQHAQGQHRACHQTRHRRPGGHHLRGDHLRGFRPRRRRHPGGCPDRQPQPHQPAKFARSSSAAAATWARRGASATCSSARAWSASSPTGWTKTRSWESSWMPAPTI